MSTETALFQPAAVLVAPPRELALRLGGISIRLPWSTPTQWWVLLVVVLLAELLFVQAVRHAVNQREDAFKSITGDCAPSIIAAQQIRTSLADYDANLTNVLLCAPGSTERTTALKLAQDRRHEFTGGLLNAAANITFGQAEREPITTMANGLGDYQALMARAQTRQESGDAAGAIATSRDASRLMHRIILPAADRLDDANSQVLDRTYDEQSSRSLRARVWMALTGLLYIATLVGAQYALWRGTRRRVNPGLLAATLLTGCFALYGAAASWRSTQQLRVATKDAFDSVRFLWKARAIAYDANGAESRWLYDRAQAGPIAREFSDDADQIARVPAHTSLQKIAERASARPSERLPDGFDGLLAKEVGNVTFPGELDAACAAIRTFGAYLDVDQTIRRLENAGRHDAAVALCLSYAPGGSNATFAAFDAALDRVLVINQHAFEENTRDGVQNLTRFDLLIPAFGVLAAAAAGAGFWPRIREYSA
jgi:hypothetical protein